MRLIALECLLNRCGLVDRLDSDERDQRMLCFSILEVEDPFDHSLFTRFDLGLAFAVREKRLKFFAGRAAFTDDELFDRADHSREADWCKTR